MIGRILAGVGQVGALLLDAALADRREVARLRGLLRTAQDDLATSEQRCNLLAHRVEEAESDVRAARTAVAQRDRWLGKAEADGELFREERNEARQQRDGLRLDLSMAEARVRDAEQEATRWRSEAMACVRQRDDAQTKLDVLLRGEAATRAEAGES